MMDCEEYDSCSNCGGYHSVCYDCTDDVDDDGFFGPELDEHDVAPLPTLSGRLTPSPLIAPAIAAAQGRIIAAIDRNIDKTLREREQAMKDPKRLREAADKIEADAERKRAADLERAAQLREEATRLENFPPEPAVDGSVLVFTKTFATARSYTYAALRANGAWYLTGQDGDRRSWAALTAFINSPERILWMRRPDTEGLLKPELYRVPTIDGGYIGLFSPDDLPNRDFRLKNRWRWASATGGWGAADFLASWREGAVRAVEPAPLKQGDEVTFQRSKGKKGKQTFIVDAVRRNLSGEPEYRLRAKK